MDKCVALFQALILSTTSNYYIYQLQTKLSRHENIEVQVKIN